jgi:hypothetical protein
MSKTSHPPAPLGTPPATNWSVGGLFLEALAERDFAQMSDCFEPEATMRALLPYGPDEFQGAAQIISAFRHWFGGAEAFEVLDGSVGDIGDRLHVSWRLRVRPTPMGDDDWHVIEQQAYLRASERIETLDLLCSGFMPAGRH